jgi:protein ImuB
MAAGAIAFNFVPDLTPAAAGAVHSERHRLWLCAYFPDLALESLEIDGAQVAATLETHKGKSCVHSMSAKARAAGIETGMTPAAARALCPELVLRRRNGDAERQALQKLATAALEFSPWVSLQPSHSLLLEVRSCLRLFGGAGSLRERLRSKLSGLQYKSLIAVTPSATAARLLARLEIEAVVSDRQALRGLLGPLPLVALELDDKILRRLQQAGLKSLVDLWRLPRDGLARRYGMPLLRQLDELAGLAQPAMMYFQNPPRFHASREMPAELEHLQHFFPAIAQLAAEFADFLLARDATALGLDLILRHHKHPATRLALDFRAGSRDPGYWLSLLQEKLERTPLPAAVNAIVLQSDAIVPFQPASVDLFDTGADGGNWQAVLDQLQARLGRQALQQVGLQNDHRPERGSSGDIAAATLPETLPPRPLWLLPQPKAMALQGLQLITEAERIESGWWDGHAVRRDYRQAIDKQGRRLWVFQDLHSGSWFLHGLFG